MSRTTNDEQEIRRWAERHNAHPVQKVLYTHDSEPAVLGFVFGEAPAADSNLQPIAWSTFFAQFHLLGLVLSYDGGSGYELLKVEQGHSGWFEGKPMQA